MINSYSHDTFNNKRLGDWGLKDPVHSHLKTTAKHVKRERQGEKMTTIREQATNYVKPETLNIADLKEVSTEMDVKHKVVNGGTADEFSYYYIIVDEKEYRVPNSVLKQLKAQLEEKPESVKFKVTKTGEGLKTEYNVIMLG